MVATGEIPEDRWIDRHTRFFLSAHDASRRGLFRRYIRWRDTEGHILSQHQPIAPTREGLRQRYVVPPCVDGPWNARLLYRWDRSGSVMCPAFYRGIVATGPDEVRGWRANQFVELKALGEPRLCSIPGPTGSPSLLSPSFLRSTIAEPDSSNGCVPVSLLSSQKSPRDAGGLVCYRYRHHACRFALQELRDPWE